MTQQLYIKTNGPIPEGCNHFTITAGKVYEAYDICMERHFCSAISDTGSMLRIDLKRECPCELCQLKWRFCDQLGNPVPAPWEGEQKAPVNWQAHAEALAEALREAAGALHNVRAVSHMCDGCVSYETANDALSRNHGFEQVLAAFDQDRG